MSSLARQIQAGQPSRVARIAYGVMASATTVNIEGDATAVEVPQLASAGVLESGDYVAVQIVGADALIIGRVASPTVRLGSGDASLSSTDHPLQMGPTDGVNMAVDGNEIQARDNGSASPLLLNFEGGEVRVGGSAGASDTTTLTVRSLADAVVLIEADTDNVTETHNPTVRFEQDGGGVWAEVGITDSNDLVLSSSANGGQSVTLAQIIAAL